MTLTRNEPIDLPASAKKIDVTAHKKATDRPAISPMYSIYPIYAESSDIPISCHRGRQPRSVIVTAPAYNDSECIVCN